MLNLGISFLQQAYRRKALTPAQVVDQVLARAEQNHDHNIWITLLSRTQIDSYLAALAGRTPEELPLYGVPFAIKDNIDLAGVPTTAACAAYAYTPSASAFVVQRLLAAGAIPIGKTNMDQFATGLVGTRSPPPWGACANAFDPAYISGGSSSGSAVAVALGLVSFALGTDTAGSGRVPAAFNNIVGMKPTKGLLSTSGVVPACRSLDCVSIFALNTDDADAVFAQACAYDVTDDYSRRNVFANNHRHYGEVGSEFSFGVPRADQLRFFANADAQQLFTQAVRRLQSLGGRLREIDYEPFSEAARLLYEGPWVAERYAAVGDFMAGNPQALLPVLRDIIGGSRRFSADDVFRAQYRLAHCKRLADAALVTVDFIVTPTAGTIYTIAEVTADPIALNSNLGYYTNYMNLLDCCGLALPGGFLPSGLPFGITLAAAAGADRKLLSFGRRWQLALGTAAGRNAALFQGRELPPYRQRVTVDVAVCGAHLQGQALNWQLLERGATLLRRDRTMPCYKLYALSGSGPPRPGLVRAGDGRAIDVEVWRMPAGELGGFLADIPPPLGLGKVELQGGIWLTGFICEPYVLDSAEDISRFGGWRAYLAAIDNNN